MQFVMTSRVLPGRWLSAKTVLIMKLTAIFLLATCLQVSANGFSQAVTLSGKNLALEHVFTEVESQTGYVFVYTSRVMKNTRPVTLSVKDMPLQQFLLELLKDQPVEFTITKKTILLFRKALGAEVFADKQLNSSTEDMSPRLDLVGRVSDADGKPLGGASIMIKGTRRGTTSSNDGTFSLPAMGGDNIIVVSYSGYATQTIKVANRSVIEVVMELVDNPLNVVAVIAYGKQTQRYSAGNVSTVKGEDIAKQPVNNPLLALVGRVPGLFITQTNGISGGGMKVRIQGQNSIGNGNDPLYVIDGVPYVSQLLPTSIGGSLGGNGGNARDGSGNPMSFINPNDIESISILKDADATAIYGSRAANGAILITTKKGKAGKTSVDINLRQGWAKVSRTVDLMNTPQYLLMRHEARANDGLNPYPSITADPNDPEYDINGAWDTTHTTNWQKVLIGGTALYSDYSASVSGGSPTAQYLVGGTWHRETTVFPGNFADQKGAVHFSLNTQSSNQRFKIQLTGNYLFDNNRIPIADLTNEALSIAPTAPALYNPDGTINYQLLPSGQWTFGNPLAYIYQPYQLKTNNLLANAILSYSILPGLNARISLGYNRLEDNQLFITPITTWDVVRQSLYGVDGRSASYAFNTITSWIAEPQLEYKKTIGRVKLELLMGATFNERNSDGLNISAYGYTSDALLKDVGSAITINSRTSFQSTYKYGAAFARFNLNLKDRYLVSLNARRDGSSRFGEQSQFHSFGSVGAGWIFSQEDFFKDHLTWLSFGKLKGSYGTTGSDQISDYRFMSLYSAISVGIPYQQTQGYQTTSLPNPYLQWEETKKFQAGISLGFLKDKLLLDVTYANNRSSNQLIGLNLPGVTGFPDILQNFPATVTNTTWEFSLSSDNIEARDFSWKSNLNFTLPQNRLSGYPANAPGAGSSYINGQPLGITSAYHYLGVDPATGLYLVADQQGMPTTTPNFLKDRTQLINTAFPKYYGGFQNSVSYKGLTLDVLFQFVKQVKLNYFFGNGLAGSTFVNQPTWVVDRWQKAGDNASIQKYNADFSAFGPLNNAQNSDRAYSDASFIRLKNLSLSYSVPDRLMERIHMEHLRLFVQAQNLLTITSFNMFDPETGLQVLPPLRNITVGLNLSL